MTSDNNSPSKPEKNMGWRKGTTLFRHNNAMYRKNRLPQNNTWKRSLSIPFCCISDRFLAFNSVSNCQTIP